jgi:uncharacterized protein (TIGR00725 family)
LITGACPGVPYQAVRGAKAAGGLVVGNGFDVLIYTGSGLMGREITNIRSCDIVIIVGGRTGTLGEFAIAYDEGRLIGVLTGTGGITALIPEMINVSRKQTGAHVIYDDDPLTLVTRLIMVYKAEHTRKPSCFCEDRPSARADGRKELTNV